MAGGLLSLKWNNHQSTFLHVLSSLYLNDTLSDVTLACEGEFFSAHKLVLATCSEYFEKIFERIDGKHSVIVLKDIKSEELEALLNYMYEGEVNVLQEKLSGLIKAAEHLKIKGLSDSDEGPENSSSRFFKRGRKGVRRSSLNEPLVSPQPKRKRHGSEAAKVHRNENYLESNTEQTAVSCEENVAPIEKNKTQNRVEDPTLPAFDKLHAAKSIKDEPNEEVKKEIDEFEVQASQYTDESSFIPRVFTEIPVSSLSLESDRDDNGASHTINEGMSSSSNLWDTGDVSTLAIPNTIGHRLNSSEKPIRSFSEHMTITPDDLVPLLTPEDDDENSENTSGVFACQNCPFKTFQKNIYDTHLRLHFSENSQKTFSCQFCSYSCLTKSNLKCHIRRHTGEKPFSCPYCSYRSSQSSNIKIHVRRMHKNDEPQDGRNGAFM